MSCRTVEDFAWSLESYSTKLSKAVFRDGGDFGTGVDLKCNLFSLHQKSGGPGTKAVSKLNSLEVAATVLEKHSGLFYYICGKLLLQ